MKTRDAPALKEENTKSGQLHSPATLTHYTTHRFHSWRRKKFLSLQEIRPEKDNRSLLNVLNQNVCINHIFGYYVSNLYRHLWSYYRKVSGGMYNLLSCS